MVCGVGCRMASEVVCRTCGRVFACREEKIQRMLFAGQVVSKGKRPRDDWVYACGHLREEDAD